MLRKTIQLSAVLALALVAVATAQDDAQPVCQASFTIPARSAKAVTFIVPEHMKKGLLEGQFKATGGMRNSIEVWVMNDDEFVNWQNHHPIRTLYNSRKVTQGTVRAFLLEPGKYHIVFNNDFSLITPKAVEANILLRRAPTPQGN